jgi:hypothetical protein
MKNARRHCVPRAVVLETIKHSKIFKWSKLAGFQAAAANYV